MSESKFNVGDKIRAIHSSHGGGIVASHIYTVFEVTQQGAWVRFIDSKGDLNGWGKDHFELNDTPQDTVVPTKGEFIAAMESIDKANKTVLAYLDGLNERLKPHGVSLMLSPHD